MNAIVGFATLLDMTRATCDICENGQAAVEAFAASSPGQYRLILMDCSVVSISPAVWQGNFLCQRTMNCFKGLSENTIPSAG